MPVMPTSTPMPNPKRTIAGSMVSSVVRAGLLIDFPDLLGQERGVRQDTKDVARNSGISNCRRARLPASSLPAGVSIRGLGHSYGELRTIERLDLEVAGARGARPGRPLRLRQVDPAGADLRPAGAERRGDRGRRRERRRRRLSRCAYMPQRDLLLPWYRRSTTRPWRCATAASARARRGAEAGGAVRALRPRRLRAAAAGRALGRDAPARRLPAHPGRRQAAAGPRRALRRARRDHPGGDAGVAGRRPARRPAHRRPRHPRRRGGALPLRPRRRPLRPPGPSSPS